uniref:Uncharacterized protein n=1 Tax=Schizaphis graminum TaxID=13262 RepID=A0A2S2P6W2_SCHGA
MDDSWSGGISIRHKEKLSFSLKKSPFNIVLKKTFSIYRNLLNMLIRMYYFDKIQMWEIINDVTGKRKNNNFHINNILGTDGLIKNENTDISNELNNFFSNVGKNIEYDFDKNGFLKK